MTTQPESRAFPVLELSDLCRRLEVQRPGEEIHQLCAELYPICRSITGNGVRDTLSVLKSLVSLQIHEVPTGTPVLDWTVPKEWNIRDACLKNSQGERVVDFKKSNLHVVGYSVPVRGKAMLSELRGRLHSLPDTLELIPYRNSYFKEDWGFCLSDRQLQGLPERRMSRVSWNFGGGPVSIRLRSSDYHCARRV